MDPKARALAEARLFHRLAFLSAAGFLFYYSNLFFDTIDSPFLLKALAISFLLATIPLPVIALNNRKLFPRIKGTGKKALNMATLVLLCHHFLMTFVFVMILKGEGAL